MATVLLLCTSTLVGSAGSPADDSATAEQWSAEMAQARFQVQQAGAVFKAVRGTVACV